MYGHNATLYPMLAVGTFMCMFWTGIVVASELGLGCVSMLITGLLSACIATVGVCELERRDGQGLAARGSAPLAQPASGGDRSPGRPRALQQRPRPPAVVRPRLSAGPNRAL
jgi:hypothetical protein